MPQPCSAALTARISSAIVVAPSPSRSKAMQSEVPFKAIPTPRTSSPILTAPSVSQSPTQCAASAARGRAQSSNPYCPSEAVKKTCRVVATNPRGKLEARPGAMSASG